MVVDPPAFPPAPSPTAFRGPDGFAVALERVIEPLELVERAMREQLVSESDVIGSVGGHVLSSGGKRIRPAILLLAAELCGYTGPRRVQVAAAVELLHTATLLHDDVVDHSPLRRGRPSAMALWNNRRAVLAGDFFYARASSMIVEDGDLDVLWVFSNTIRLMAEGEILQLQRSFDPSVTEAHYYAVIERKSAALLGAASEAGAILGGVTRAERRRLAEFGRELGLAFQIRDDALDYEAGADVLGKEPFTDLREGKVTLPLLLTLKRCDDAEREDIERVLKSAAQRSAEDAGSPADAELRPVLAAIDRYRGVADSVRRAEEHVGRARAAIAPFPDGKAKQALLAAAAFAAARDR
jgi:octaprenyl-diphosphate synthase